MAYFIVTDTQLHLIANKIREKTGLDMPIEFTSEFISEIEKLVYTGDANATADDILSGKTVYVNKQKLTGTIPTLVASTYPVSTEDQIIAPGQYIGGVQTIRGVTTSNISAENIKKGAVVRVGDTSDPTSIKNVIGTYQTPVTTANIDAANIKNGVNIQVGYSDAPGGIKNVTGTFRSPVRSYHGYMDIIGSLSFTNSHASDVVLKSRIALPLPITLCGINPDNLYLYNRDGSLTEYSFKFHLNLKKINSMSVDSNGYINMSLDIYCTLNNINSSYGNSNLAFQIYVYYI